MARTAKTRAVDETAPGARRTGLVRGVVGWIGKVLRLLLASLIVSIAIEWIGMHIWWPELGLEHSRQMVEAESTFLDRNISISWARSEPVAAINQLASRASLALSKSRIAMYLADWARGLKNQLNSSSPWRALKDALGPYALAARNIGNLYVIRLTVLCLAAPLFVLLAWVGFVDGLVQRDLRRWGGGRESSYVYHYAKRSNLVFVALAGFIYLALPFSVHPAIVLVPFAVICAGSIGLTASRFKKYL